MTEEMAVASTLGKENGLLEADVFGALPNDEEKMFVDEELLGRLPLLKRLDEEAAFESVGLSVKSTDVNDVFGVLPVLPAVIPLVAAELVWVLPWLGTGGSSPVGFVALDRLPKRFTGAAGVPAGAALIVLALEGAEAAGAAEPNEKRFGAAAAGVDDDVAEVVLAELNENSELGVVAVLLGGKREDPPNVKDGEADPFADLVGCVNENPCEVVESFFADGPPALAWLDGMPTLFFWGEVPAITASAGSDGLCRCVLLLGQALDCDPVGLKKREFSFVSADAPKLNMLGFASKGFENSEPCFASVGAFNENMFDWVLNDLENGFSCLLSAGAPNGKVLGWESDGFEKGFGVEFVGAVKEKVLEGGLKLNGLWEPDIVELGALPFVAAPEKSDAPDGVGVAPPFVW